MNTTNLDAELKNELSAALYGQYYYELPNGGKGHRAERDTIDRLSTIAQAEIAKAKIEELKLIQQTGKDHDLAGAVKWLIDDRIATLKADTESNKEGVEVNE